jgi:hypothetical protein
LAPGALQHPLKQSQDRRSHAAFSSASLVPVIQDTTSGIVLDSVSNIFTLLFQSHGNFLPNLSVAATGRRGPAHQKKATVNPAMCLIVLQQSILPPEKLSAAVAVNTQTPNDRSKDQLLNTKFKGQSFCISISQRLSFQRPQNIGAHIGHNRRNTFGIRVQPICLEIILQIWRHSI